MWRQECRTILNIANAMEEDGASYYTLESMYHKACDLADKASNPRLKATALNSLAVLQEMNGLMEKSRRFRVALSSCIVSMYNQPFPIEDSMAAVNRLCADHDIDLDEDSDISPSQTGKNDLGDEDDVIDLDELIGGNIFSTGKFDP